MYSKKYEASRNEIIFILDKMINVWVDMILLRRGNRRSDNGNDSEYCYFCGYWEMMGEGAYVDLRELIEFY